MTLQSTMVAKLLLGMDSFKQLDLLRPNLWESAK